MIAATIGLVLAAALSAGCSSGASPTKAVSGWFGGDDKAAAKGGDVFYAGSGGLNVHAEPKASSAVIGRLSAGEKVVRSKQKDGFAQVEARRGAVKGWVVNSRLLRRPPAAKPAAGATTGGNAVPSAEPGEPEATEEPTAEETPGEAHDGEAPDSSEAPEASPPAEAAAPAAPPPAPKGVGASVFDPY